jgi:hypothetical protein
MTAITNTNLQNLELSLRPYLIDDPLCQLTEAEKENLRKGTSILSSNSCNEQTEVTGNWHVHFPVPGRPSSHLQIVKGATKIRQLIQQHRLGDHFVCEPWYIHWNGKCLVAVSKKITLGKMAVLPSKEVLTYFKESSTDKPRYSLNGFQAHGLALLARAGYFGVGYKSIVLTPSGQVAITHPNTTRNFLRPNLLSFVTMLGSTDPITEMRTLFLMSRLKLSLPSSQTVEVVKKQELKIVLQRAYRSITALMALAYGANAASEFPESAIKTSSIAVAIIFGICIITGLFITIGAWKHSQRGIDGFEIIKNHPGLQDLLQIKPIAEPKRAR